VAACLPLACLPASRPPAGEHLLPGRDFERVYLSPSERSDVASSLLVTAADPDAALATYQLPVADLFAVAPSGDPPRLLVHGFVDDDANPSNPTIATDSLGRLLLVQAFPGERLPVPFSVLRLDVGTGREELLAQGHGYSVPTQANTFLLSPARTEVCVDPALAVFALDGGPKPIGARCDRLVFVGEDIYYYGGTICDSTAGLCRLHPDGTSELVFASAGIVGLEPLTSPGAGKLLISTLTTDTPRQFSLLDGATAAVTPLPAQTQGATLVTLSPDGRWLGFAIASGTTDEGLFLFDWTTGDHARVAPSQLGQKLGRGLWRPGRDELWLADPDSDRFAVVTLAAAENGTAAVDVRLYHGSFPDGFLPDGQYWYRFASTVNVGSADSPTALPVPISLAGTTTAVPRQLANGRLLVESWAIHDSRMPEDIAIVDPDTGSRQTVCGGCRLVALGQTRALLLVDWALADRTGSLVLVDLTTLARTLLAESVCAVAVDRGQSADVPTGADVLLPDTQVAFLVRNRLTAPYDGLWLARLP
jgi:hypothetical protein